MFEKGLQALALFPEAFLGGMVIALACTLLGLFVVLRRVVFIGIALSEISACGIALAMVMHLPPFAGAALLTLAGVLYVAQPLGEQRIPRDAILGVLFVGSAALSILLVAGSGFGLHEVKSLLYGDLILTSRSDLWGLLAVLVPTVVFMVLFFRPILFSALDPDGARVLGVRVRFWETCFFVALGLAISSASKAGGAMLVFAYLVVVPSAALMLSRRLHIVIVLAILMGIAYTLIGLVVSFVADSPTNPTIIAVLTVGFGIAAAVNMVRRKAAGFAENR
jgi:ABC-type Mn2+/Zn2+ transport system permease subunit